MSNNQIENSKTESLNQNENSSINDSKNKSVETPNEKENKSDKKEREFKINSGNVAIFASGIALVLGAVNKLLRMLVLVSGGIIIFLYIISALLSFFALFSCVKNAIKEKQITIDSFFCGISILVLILI